MGGWDEEFNDDEFHVRDCVRGYCDCGGRDGGER